MVRLKEKNEQKYDIFEFISIPYGAIKSWLSKITKKYFIRFQFLMVRLKVFICVFRLI